MRDVRRHHCLCLVEEGVLSKSDLCYVSDLPFFLALSTLPPKAYTGISDNHDATRFTSNLTQLTQLPGDRVYSRREKLTGTQLRAHVFTNLAP